MVGEMSTRCLVCQALIPRGSRCPAHVVAKAKAHTARRVAAMGGGNGWAQSALRARIRVRDGHACVLCGSRGPLEVDHITPLLQGGAHTEANMRTLCRSCHVARSRGENRLRLTEAHPGAM